MQGPSVKFCVVLEVYLNTPVLLSGPGLGKRFPKPFHTTPISSRRIKLIRVGADQWVFIAGSNLVGGFNPVETYAHQIGSFPQVKGKHRKYLKPPPGPSNCKAAILFIPHEVKVAASEGFCVESTGPGWKTSQNKRVSPKVRLFCWGGCWMLDKNSKKHAHAINNDTLSYILHPFARFDDFGSFGQWVHQFHSFLSLNLLFGERHMHWATALNYVSCHGLPLESRYIKTIKNTKISKRTLPRPYHLKQFICKALLLPFFWLSLFKKKAPQTPHENETSTFCWATFPPPKTAPAVRLRRFLKDHMASLVRSPLHRPTRMGFVGRLWNSGSEMVGPETVENQMALGFDWGEIIPLVEL